MDIVIRTVGLKLTKSQQALVEEKIGRIEHYGPAIVRTRVFIHKDSVHASSRQYSVRVLAEIRGKDVTAEECGPDVASALDIVAEKMERRLRKYKTGRLARREKLSDRRKE